MRLGICAIALLELHLKKSQRLVALEMFEDVRLLVELSAPDEDGLIHATCVGINMLPFALPAQQCAHRYCWTCLRIGEQAMVLGVYMRTRPTPLAWARVISGGAYNATPEGKLAAVPQPGSH